MEFKAEISSGRLVRAFNRFPQQLTKNVNLALKRQSVAIQKKARQEHRYTPRSGNLDRSIEYKTYPADLKAEVGIEGSVAPYGLAIHDGSKKHEIKAKRSKALRWVQSLGRSGASGFAFAKKIMHPGTKPDPFITDAAKTLHPQFNKKIDKAVSNAAKGAFV